MKGEKFGKLSEAKEWQFGKIEGLTLWNIKHRGGILRIIFARILLIFSCKEYNKVLVLSLS